MFGELLAMPNVQALRESDEAHAPHLALLELFAYGTYAQYRAAPAGTFPPLKDEQLEKLRIQMACSGPIHDALYLCMRCVPASLALSTRPRT